MRSVRLLEFKDLPIGARFAVLDVDKDGTLCTACKVYRKTTECFAVRLASALGSLGCEQRMDPVTVVVEFKDQRGGLVV